MEPWGWVSTLAGGALALAALADVFFTTLHPDVEHLDLATSRLLGTIAQQYLGTEVMDAIDDPEVGDDDRRWVEALASQMRDGLHEGWAAEADDERALAIAARLRHFLAALSQLTHWAAEHDPNPTTTRT